MKHIGMACILFFLLISGNVFANNKTAEKDTSTFKGWVPQAIAGLNVSQIALSNWTQGGENSLTWTLIGETGLKYISPQWTLKNHLKVSYGRTRLGTQAFRTNENDLFFETVLAKNIGWAVDPFLSNSVRTTITKGYSYKTDPPKETANFFDPGYITQSLGFTYDKYVGFKTRLGFAVQETFTNRHREYSDDTLTTAQEAFKFETGLESVSSINYSVVDNVVVKSKLRLFTRYEMLDVWDVRWDNAVIAKVNDFLNVNFSFLLIYEKRQSIKTQIKQSLQLGLRYTII